MVRRAALFDSSGGTRRRANAAVALTLFLVGVVCPRPLPSQQPSDGAREVAITFEARSGTAEAFAGTLSVPADRSSSSGDRLELSYVRFPSTSDDPGSPIVYLAGGPGGSGIGGARGNRFEFLMNLRRVADVIAFDQRGTGGSEPDDVTCRHEAGVRLDRPGSVELFLDILHEETRRCVRSFIEAGVAVRGLTTAESADDLEALRKALGAERLSLLGVSYGTHLALAMVRRHPGSVDRMVLAGVEGPDHTIKMPAAVEASLVELAGMVASDSVYRGRLPDLVTTLDSLVIELNRKPLSWKVLPSVTVTIGGWDLQRFVGEMSGRRQPLSELPAIVYAMSRGDFSELARWSYGERQPASTHIMNLAMDCASYASGVRLAKIRRQAVSAVTGATTDFPLPEICSVPDLPRLSDEFRSPLESSVPALLISGTLDGRTPVANADEIASGLPHARGMTIENATHGSELLLASPEIGDEVAGFFRGDPPRHARVALPAWSFDRPAERSLAADLLDRLIEGGFEATARWYSRILALHAEDDVYDLDAGVLNRLGYDLLAADEQALAIDVFRLNTVGHPGEANPWDSLGEAYLAAGNRAEAIVNYRRSLRLNPANDNARRVLRKLGAEE